MLACRFWDEFGDTKWLSGLVAPEFAEKKHLATRLLHALQQRASKDQKTDATCRHCGRPMQSNTFCGQCGVCAHGRRGRCGHGCSESAAKSCVYCSTPCDEPFTFCTNQGCNRCPHGRLRSRRCDHGCAGWLMSSPFFIC